MKSIDEEEQDQVAADRFIKNVELEELTMQLEEETDLSAHDRAAIKHRISVLQAEIGKAESAFASLAIAAEEQRDVVRVKAKAKKDD